MDENYAVKLTVTFSDGSTEDFDVFLAAVAGGLIVAGKEDGHVLYTSGEKLTTQSIACVAATPDVCVALLQAVGKLTSSMIESTPPEMRLDFVAALLQLQGKSTVRYHESRSVKLNEG